jgi:periplasmic divalent cation tolerance protein
MDQLIEIHWSCGSIDEARKVCRYLVQERYVACAQIIPWIESVYMWNNQLETEQESKVVLKTRRNKYELIRDIILDNCTYEIPEITYVTIDGGNDDYLNWLIESTPDMTRHQ